MHSRGQKHIQLSRGLRIDSSSGPNQTECACWRTSRKWKIWTNWTSRTCSMEKTSTTGSFFVRDPVKVIPMSSFRWESFQLFVKKILIRERNEPFPFPNVQTIRIFNSKFRTAPIFSDIEGSTQVVTKNIQHNKIICGSFSDLKKKSTTTKSFIVLVLFPHICIMLPSDKPIKLTKDLAWLRRDWRFKNNNWCLYKFSFWWK